MVGQQNGEGEVVVRIRVVEDEKVVMIRRLSLQFPHLRRIVLCHRKEIGGVVRLPPLKRPPAEGVAKTNRFGLREHHEKEVGRRRSQRGRDDRRIGLSISNSRVFLFVALVVAVHGAKMRKEGTLQGHIALDRIALGNQLFEQQLVCESI